MTRVPLTDSPLLRALPRPTPIGPLDAAARSLVHRRLASLSSGGLIVNDQRGAARFGAGDVAARVDVTAPAFYRSAALGGAVGVAESYIRGEWSTDDLVGLLRLFLRNRDARSGFERGVARLTAPLRLARHKFARNSRPGSRRNIHAHYDLSNEFFATFLDETMTYSAAYFETPETTLRDASIAKLDRLCRMAALTPDDHLLEIGTGWGSLALHAAQTYGCRVTTTTISDAQHALAGERVRAAGLGDRVTLLRSDYRDLEGVYDKLISIEMIEAVGHEHLPGYFSKCASLLKPGGRMALQVITMPDGAYARYRRSPDFIQRYVFPGSCCPSLTALTTAMSRASDLRVEAAEDIGAHYATTLRRWRERFAGRLDEVRGLGFDEPFIRLWEYYLAYCEAGFAERYIGDLQMTLRRRIGVAS